MDDVFLAVGGLLVVMGVALKWGVPEALIVAGIFFIGTAVLIGKQNALAAKSVSEQQPTEDR
jgi:hypothetical protein